MAALEAHPDVVAAVNDMTVALAIAGALDFVQLSIMHCGFGKKREGGLLCLVLDLPPKGMVTPIVRAANSIPQIVYEVPFHGREGIFLPQFTWANRLDRVIPGPSAYPEVMKRAIEAELRNQGVPRWDRLVPVSDIPLQQRI